MRRPRALLCLSLAAGLALAAPSTAHAQARPSSAAPGKEQAKRLFDEGVDLEKKADYAGALAKYKEAEQITVTAGLRFHKGYCLEMTGKIASAVEEYDAADKLAREQNKQDVHTAILVRLDPLRSRVPQIAIRLTTPAPGAEVQLDGVTVAPALLEGKSFRLDPGEHTLTAHAAGYKSYNRKLVTPESVTTTVDLGLERNVTAPVVATGPVAAPAAAGGATEAPPASGSTTEPPSESRRGRSYALPIVTTAGAVALAGAGVAFFLVASGAHEDAQASCLTKTSCDDEQTRVRTFDALALGSFIGAAGLGIVSIVLWTSKDTRAVGAAVPPPRTRMLATPTTLGLEGTF